MPATERRSRFGLPALVGDIERYLTQYVAFTTPDYPFVLALWIIGTFFYKAVDTFPYLTITSLTKRSGKTRLMEVMKEVVAGGKMLSAVTSTSFYKSLSDPTAHVTMFADEVERLGGEQATVIREVLNGGHRRTGMVERPGGQWPTFCPKVFALIGDVFDTLRDRCIIITLQRVMPSVPLKRFVFADAILEAGLLKDRIGAAALDHMSDFTDIYRGYAGLPFLTDRDEELWTVLFCLCEIFAPERVQDLRRIASDLCTLKTAPRTSILDRNAKKALDKAEANMEAYETGIRLVQDVRSVFLGMGEPAYLRSVDILAGLKAIDIAPWRKYRGEGLTIINLSDLLRQFKVLPKYIKHRGKTIRGYRFPDVERAYREVVKP